MKGRCLCIPEYVKGTCDPDYPLQKKRHSLEFLRTIGHLRPRTNTFAAVFRVRSLMAQAIHRFFGDRGFVYIHTPIITASDCEGAGEMFRVTTHNQPDNANDFFGKWAGLTVSGQLAAEAYAAAFRDVYTFGPTFRAENSNTPTHAAEFWMVEPEICFADLDDVMTLAEDMLKYIVAYALRHARDELEFFDRHIEAGLLAQLDHAADADFARISYTDAMGRLEKSRQPFQYPVKWGAPLQTEHERYLTEQIFKKPVFVRDYPRDIKSFYMRQNDDSQTVAAADLLVPGIGELIGGSQREERADKLLEGMTRHGLDPSHYQWYTDLRRFGGVRHGGFGLGFERCIMYVTGMKNIRDVISYPRTPRQLEY